MVFRIDMVSFGDELIAKHMVHVTMGVQVPNQPELVIGQVFSHKPFLLIVIAGRIDDDAFAGFIGKKIGIYLEEVESHCIDTDHLFIVLE